MKLCNVLKRDCVSEQNWGKLTSGIRTSPAEDIKTFNHLAPSSNFVGLLAPQVWFTRPLLRKKSHSLDILLSRPLQPAPINHSLIRGLWDWAQLPLGALLWHLDSSQWISAVLGVFIYLCFTPRASLHFSFLVTEMVGGSVNIICQVIMVTNDSPCVQILLNLLHFVLKILMCKCIFTHLGHTDILPLG